MSWALSPTRQREGRDGPCWLIFGTPVPPIEELDYPGLSTVVRRNLPEPEIERTFIKQLGESNSKAGDQYAGLDRFGRVAEQPWRDTDTGNATDRFPYGHDENGNRLYRKNLIDATFRERYHPDGASKGD